METKTIKNITTCGTCIHFIQHYFKEEGFYKTVNCGHCVYPRLKIRNEFFPACSHYEQQELEIENEEV